MESLRPALRRELRARAHHLHPVVSIGHHGLTAAVLHEIDIALTAHELIKVRVQSDDRDQRTALLERIRAALDCAPVSQIGKLLVLWRPRPAAAIPAAARPPRPIRKPGTGPRHSPADPVSRRRRPEARLAIPPAGASRPAARGSRRTPAAPSGVPRAASPRRRRGP